MDPTERERRLRETFGPREAGATTSSRLEPAARRSAPRRLIAGIIGLLTLLGATSLGFALTPHDHVAPTCWWWSAREVSDVTAGSRGCVRGYAAVGGWLATGRSRQDFALFYSLSNPDTPPARPACPFRPGDAVVVRYHAVFDDGQTILVIDDCR